MELSMPMRLRQYSSSVSGPASSLSFTSFTAGARSFSAARAFFEDLPLAGVLPETSRPPSLGDSGAAGSSQLGPPKNASPPCVSESVASAVSTQESKTSSR